MLWLQALCFHGIPECINEWVSASTFLFLCLFSGSFSSVCFVLFRYIRFCFSLLYFILLYPYPVWFPYYYYSLIYYITIAVSPPSTPPSESLHHSSPDKLYLISPFSFRKEQALPQGYQSYNGIKSYNKMRHIFLYSDWLMQHSRKKSLPEAGKIVRYTPTATDRTSIRTTSYATITYMQRS